MRHYKLVDADALRAAGCFDALIGEYLLPPVVDAADDAVNAAANAAAAAAAAAAAGGAGAAADASAANAADNDDDVDGKDADATGVETVQEEVDEGARVVAAPR